MIFKQSLAQKRALKHEGLITGNQNKKKKKLSLVDHHFFSLASVNKTICGTMRRIAKQCSLDLSLKFANCRAERILHKRITLRTPDL